TLETLDVFWEIWKDEYLNSLRERTQIKHKSPRSAIIRPPSLGEIVLVNEPHIPRGMWKLAKINKLNKSSDGNVRSVQIELPFGKLFNRPVNMLYPLEVEQEDQPKDSATELTNAKDEEPIENEEPIARRTRSLARQQRNPISLRSKSSFTMLCMLVTVLSIMSTRTLATKTCKWSGISFNIAKRKHHTKHELKVGIISKFEIERTNAEIEILADKQKPNPVSYQQNMETIWQEISQEGEELAEQLDDEIGKATLLIQNELSEFAVHWCMIIGGTSVLILLIVLIIVKLNCQLILFPLCPKCSRNSNQKTVAIPMNLLREDLHNKKEFKTTIKNVLSYQPKFLLLASFLPSRECREFSRNYESLFIKIKRSQQCREYREFSRNYESLFIKIKRSFLLCFFLLKRCVGVGFPFFLQYK
ncbi:unnamed protein product, partial [Dracunculus medinensis]|uniref:DUF5641 domain-containing protein n=1 Tax=Dracunculus medinensis TaxID=318479 RepID=A0A0N4U984_DRAME